MVGGYQAFVLSVGETNLSDGFSKSFPNLSDNIKHILISTGKWDLEKFKAVPIIIDNMFWKISENKLSQGSFLHFHKRQRCCLIICSYIGWIDKYSICQFNQYKGGVQIIKMEI